ncbi:MAG TPA: phosphoribosylanthranilate isomerase [Granulicella sp.]|jgi:phosphoribosylanthranilate isomerase|nr:phosphoribosylanthranilate isomerase [Granulicella sp.]
MWIKICANTSLADAQLAAELGADALGFVFAPSKRQVSIEQVAAITPHLPASVETVAVVQSQDAQEIVELVRSTGLTAVQLHGGLSLPLLRELHAGFAGRVPLIQTLHWSIDDDARSAVVLAAQLREIAAEPSITRVLIDAKVGNAGGGTGRSFDWKAARIALTANQAGNQKTDQDTDHAASRKIDLIVAGGLRPENVAEAIQSLEPWGVDVASGVEASPGRKDPLKLKRFFENARAQD